jgi:hypothetical protein
MAIDAAAIRLPVVRSRQTGTLRKDIIEVAEADYLHVLRAIAAQEIAQQAQIGNRVTNLIVDGSGAKAIDEARYSVRAFFVQPAVIIQAIAAAWDALRRVARVGDPMAQSASQRGVVARERFAVVVGQHFVGEPGNLTERILMANPGAPVRIVGPLVEYAHAYRFMFFLRGVQPTRVAKVRRTGQKLRVPLSIHQVVLAQMRRRFPMLSWSDAWIPVASLRYVERVPTITVRTRTRSPGMAPSTNTIWPSWRASIRPPATGFSAITTTSLPTPRAEG